MDLQHLVKDLYKDHHETWDYMERMAQSVCEENCVSCASEIATLWEKELRHHFKEEEEEFFPAIKSNQNSKIIDELIVQHKWFLDKMEEMESNPTPQLIKDFCNMLIEHIKLEEELMEKIMKDPYKMDEQLKKGIEVEKEHKDLYIELQKRLKAKGVSMPISEDEFYKKIAEAHLEESKDYYKLLDEMEKQFSEGGEVTLENFVYDPTVDYLADYHLLPKEVKEIIFDPEYVEPSYETNDEIIERLKPLGWTFDYDLGAEWYGLRPIGEPLQEMWMEKGGEIDWDSILAEPTKDEMKKWREDADKETVKEKNALAKRINATGKDWNEAFDLRLKAVKDSMRDVRREVMERKGKDWYYLHTLVLENLDDLSELGYGAEKYAKNLRETYNKGLDELQFKGKTSRFNKGGEVRKMNMHDAVYYKDKTYYITEKNGEIGLMNMAQGAWGSDYPFTPISKINVSEEVTDMNGNKVEIPTSFARGGRTRYSNDPRIIESRFDTVCAETGKPIKKGEECVYYPSSKECYGLDSKQAHEFRNMQSDYDMGYNYAKGGKVSSDGGQIAKNITYKPAQSAGSYNIYQDGKYKTTVTNDVLQKMIKAKSRFKKDWDKFRTGGATKTMQGRERLYEDDNVILEYNTVSDHYDIRDAKTGRYMKDGGMIQQGVLIGDVDISKYYNGVIKSEPLYQGAEIYKAVNTNYKEAIRGDLKDRYSIESTDYRSDMPTYFVVNDDQVVDYADGGVVSDLKDAEKLIGKQLTDGYNMYEVVSILGSETHPSVGVIIEFGVYQYDIFDGEITYEVNSKIKLSQRAINDLIDGSTAESFGYPMLRISETTYKGGRKLYKGSVVKFKEDGLWYTIDSIQKDVKKPFIDIDEDSGDLKFNVRAGEDNKGNLKLLTKTVGDIDKDYYLNNFEYYQNGGSLKGTNRITGNVDVLKSLIEKATSKPFTSQTADKDGYFVESIYNNEDLTLLFKYHDANNLKSNYISLFAEYVQSEQKLTIFNQRIYNAKGKLVKMDVLPKTTKALNELGYKVENVEFKDFNEYADGGEVDPTYEISVHEVKNWDKNWVEGYAHSYEEAKQIRDAAQKRLGKAYAVGLRPLREGEYADGGSTSQFTPTIKSGGETLFLETVYNEDETKNWDDIAQNYIDAEKKEGRIASVVHKGNLHGLYREGSDYEKERQRQLEQGLVDEKTEGISILGMTKGKDNPVGNLKEEKEPELAWFTPEALKVVPKHQIPIIKGAKEEFQDAIIRINKAVADLPKTYETDGTPADEKIVYLHYMLGGSDWYIVEQDMNASTEGHIQDFGYADIQYGEWGYIPIKELVNMGNVELDLYFEPKPFGEVMGKQQEQAEKAHEARMEAVENDKWNFEGMLKGGSKEQILVNWIKDKGATNLELAKEFPNVIDFEFKGHKFHVFDNGGEFKMDDLTTNEYLGVIYFTAFDKDRTPKELALEIMELATESVEGTQELKTEVSAYKNPYELNKAIEKLVDEKGDNHEDYTPEEIEFIGYYSGYGGLEKYGAEGKGLLYEYFTPTDVCKTMWGLAYKYGYGTIGDGAILEPSVGTGNFLKFAPEDAHIDAFEINPYSAQICKILHPKANVHVASFEQMFIEANSSIKDNVNDLPKYSLVIGNPPYGVVGGKYMGMGEKKHTKASNYTEYFITRGLDLLVSGGLLVFIVGAEQKNGGKLFLDGGMTKVKEIIFDKADLIDAYRLPVGIFERTGVSSEIVIFKKR